MFSVGDKIGPIKLKEMNYFDNTYIVSLREDILNEKYLNYNSIKAGMYLNGTISSIENNKFVVVKINEFVEGILYPIHMSSVSQTAIPKKFKNSKLFFFILFP